MLDRLGIGGGPSESCDCKHLERHRSRPSLYKRRSSSAARDDPSVRRLGSSRWKKSETRDGEQGRGTDALRKSEAPHLIPIMILACFANSSFETQRPSGPLKVAGLGSLPSRKQSCKLGPDDFKTSAALPSCPCSPQACRCSSHIVDHILYIITQWIRMEHKVEFEPGFFVQSRL